MPSADPNLFKNLAFPLCSVLNDLKHLGCPGLGYNQPMFDCRGKRNGYSSPASGSENPI